MFTDLLKRDRERLAMSEAQAARRFGMTLNGYRKIEAGEEELFDSDAFDAIAELYGWPCTVVAPGGHLSYR